MKVFFWGDGGIFIGKNNSGEYDQKRRDGLYCGQYHICTIINDQNYDFMVCYLSQIR